MLIFSASLPSPEERISNGAFETNKDTKDYKISFKKRKKTQINKNQTSLLLLSEGKIFPWFCIFFISPTLCPDKIASVPFSVYVFLLFSKLHRLLYVLINSFGAI